MGKLTNFPWTIFYVANCYQRVSWNLPIWFLRFYPQFRWTSDQLSLLPQLFYHRSTINPQLSSLISLWLVSPSLQTFGTGTMPWGSGKWAGRSRPCLIHLHALWGEVLTKAQAQHLTLLAQHRLGSAELPWSKCWGKTWEKTLEQMVKED